MPDPALLAAILADPNDGARWLALATWLRDNRRNDESDAIRVYWPAIADSVAAGRTLDWCLEYVKLHAGRLGRHAREFDEGAV